MPGNRFWQARQSHFARPVALAAMPGSLLEAFSQDAPPRERVLAALSWLAPLAYRGVLAERVF